MSDADFFGKFGRQIMVAGVGEEGQKKLMAQHIVMVGVGAIASHLLPLLVGAGIKKITLIDDDIVADGNLYRQLLFRQPNIGQKKILVAEKFLRTLNPAITINHHDTKILSPDDKKFLRGDIVFDGSDNIDCKKLTDRLAQGLGIPIIIGGVAGRAGQVGFFGNNNQKRYNDIFLSGEFHNIANCQTAGVLNSTLAMVAGLMADVFFDNVFLGKNHNRFWLVDNKNFLELTC